MESPVFWSASRFSFLLRRSLAVVSIVLILQVSYGSGWWGRSRRRPAPTKRPTLTLTQNCYDQEWSKWTTCEPFCNTVRKRSRTRNNTCKPVPEVVWQTCAPEGCTHICDKVNKRCSCHSGYNLDTKDGKNCIDIDECKSNGGRGPCSYACRNLEGDYRCSCEKGYRLQGKTQCVLRDCNEPAFLPCPLTSTQQHQNGRSFTGGLDICANISSVCHNGTKYNSECSLSCPYGFSLALKNPTQPWSTFSAFDFSTPSERIICHIKTGTSTLLWHAQLIKYHCRRRNDPPFSLNLNNRVIKEHSPPGTVVGKLSAVDEQRQQTIIYSVQSPSHTPLFRCRGSTLESAVVFKWKLGGSDINSYPVLIRAQDNGAPVMWREHVFNVSVTNVNDVPRNIEISQNSVAENASIGHVVGTLSAIDDDVTTRRSTKFTWRLLANSSRHFNLSGSNVIVSRMLNYDIDKEHYVKVACYDSMTSFAESLLLIYVINAIDPPTLTLNNTRISENSKRGTVIGQIKAKSESNSDLSFTLTASNAHALTKFALSPTTACTGHPKQLKFNTTCVADLLVSGDLDFEEQSEYVVEVFVKNKESSNLGKWKIIVENVNEKPNKLDFNCMSEIPEATQSDEDLCFITISDPDNRNAIMQQHNCFVENDKRDGKYFHVNDVRDTLQVKPNNTLNYEIQQRHHVFVTCADDGIPPLSITGSVVINVTDTDEPIENLTLSKNEIAENSPLDTVVGYLRAFDPDIHRPSNFTFTIVAPQNTPFAIKHNNMLVVNGSVNFEENSEFVVTIRAADAGSFLQWPFRIHVLNMNEPPSDIRLSNHSMNEELVPGSLVSNITMIDEDENTVTQCELGNDGNGRISVNDTHLVAGETPADYEQDETRVLEISVKCCDQQKLCVTRNFSIEVKDINEPPSDIMLNNLEILENKKDIVVGNIAVVDPDENQRHSCKLTSGNDFLKISNDSKTLLLMKELNFEQENVKKFEIVCREVGNGSTYSITKQFELSVVDVNEEPSKGCLEPFSISPEQSIGSVLGSLNVTDPDNEKFTNKSDRCQDKQQLKYTLQARDENFPFEIFGGYLVKTAPTEANTMYTITVTVEDDGVLSRTSEQRRNKTLQVSFNCTIFSKTLPRPTITLSSNTINQLAVNGTLVGYLNTTRSADIITSDVITSDVTQYELVPKPCNSQPFETVGNKLILTFSEQRPVSQNDVNGVPNYVIIHVNQTRDVITSRFVIMIKDDKRLKNLVCFQNNVALKNNVDQTKLGPIRIEQTRNEETTKTCDNTEITTDQRYMCETTPRYNESSQDFAKLDLTGKISVDKDMFLRINMSLDYRKYILEKLVIVITCWDPSMPLLFIKGRLDVIIQDCERATEDERVCMRCEHHPCEEDETCSDLTPVGYRCEDMCEERQKQRRDNSCPNELSCPEHSLCSEMLDSTGRCIPENNQIMIGASFLLPNRSSCRFEKCLEDVLRNPEETCLKNIDKEFTENDRRKREAKETFHVEILRVDRSLSAKKTLLFLAVWQLENGRYELAEKSIVLSLLKSTENVVVLQEPEDCTMFEDSGINCPVSEENKARRNTGSALERPKLQAAVGSGAAIVFILIIIVVVYCLKKRKDRRKEVEKRQARTEVQDNLGFYEMELNDLNELGNVEKPKGKKPEHNFNNPAYADAKKIDEDDSIYNEMQVETLNYSQAQQQNAPENKKQIISNPIYDAQIPIQKPSKNTTTVEDPSPTDSQSSSRKNIGGEIKGDLLNPRERCQKLDPKNKYPYYEELPPVRKDTEKSTKKWFSRNSKSKDNVEGDSSKDVSPYYHVLEVKKDTSQDKQKDTSKQQENTTPLYFVLEQNIDKPYQSLHRNLEGPPPEYAQYRLQPEEKSDQAPKNRVYEEPDKLLRVVQEKNVK